MVELPNDKWIRATQQPNWSVCLDPESRYYGWKLYECNGNWVTGGKVSEDDCQYALALGPLREHWPKFQALLEHLLGSSQNGKGDSV